MAIHDPGLLENLVHLNLSCNQIAKIQNVDRLLKLKQLHLRTSGSR
jgi:hypothetical protein